jgi:hypothetical protein
VAMGGGPSSDDAKPRRCEPPPTVDPAADAARAGDWTKARRADNNDIVRDFIKRLLVPLMFEGACLSTGSF